LYSTLTYTSIHSNWALQERPGRQRHVERHQRWNTTGHHLAVSSLTTEDGYFLATLNGDGAFDTLAFDGDAHYLGIQVQCVGDASLDLRFII